MSLRVFGRTEKILRRNRRLWKRKHAKAGRVLDRIEVGVSLLHVAVMNAASAVRPLARGIAQVRADHED